MTVIQHKYRVIKSYSRQVTWSVTHASTDLSHVFIVKGRTKVHRKSVLILQIIDYWKVLQNTENKVLTTDDVYEMLACMLKGLLCTERERESQSKPVQSGSTWPIFYIEIYHCKYFHWKVSTAMTFTFFCTACTESVYFNFAFHHVHGSQKSRTFNQIHSKKKSEQL